MREATTTHFLFPTQQKKNASLKKSASLTLAMTLGGAFLTTGHERSNYHPFPLSHATKKERIVRKMYPSKLNKLAYPKAMRVGKEYASGE